MIERSSTRDATRLANILTFDAVSCKTFAAFAAEAIVEDTTWAVTETSAFSTNAVLEAVMRTKL